MNQSLEFQLGKVKEFPLFSLACLIKDLHNLILKPKSPI